jgi:transcription antitermination factor NusG
VNWYVLQTLTGSEDKVARTLRDKLGASYKPFVPTREYAFFLQGTAHTQRRVCFPGYVFVSSSLAETDFLRDAGRYIAALPQVQQILCYGGVKSDVALKSEERDFLSNLLDAEYCLRASTGIIADGRARILTGALLAAEHLITKVNRSKQQAVIEFNLLGSPRRLTAMLEIIDFCARPTITK